VAISNCRWKRTEAVVLSRLLYRDTDYNCFQGWLVLIVGFVAVQGCIRTASARLLMVAVLDLFACLTKEHRLCLRARVLVSTLRAFSSQCQSVSGVYHDTANTNTYSTVINVFIAC
jgi:hypothetical protein